MTNCYLRMQMRKIKECKQGFLGLKINLIILINAICKVKVASVKSL